MEMIGLKGIKGNCLGVPTGRKKKPPLFSFYPHEKEPGTDGACLLLHNSRPKWVLANETFRHIACLLHQGLSVDKIAKSIASEFDLPPPTAHRDVQYVADALRRFLSGPGHDVPLRIPRLSDLFIHVTNWCNLSCPHCYFASASPEDIPSRAIRKMIDEAGELGAKSITFSGGEPLLHPDIKSLLEHTSRNLSIRLLTNGTLIERDWASFLSGLGDVSVQISIDGPRKEIHDSIRGDGTFEKALRAIDYLQEAGLGEKINLSTTMMKQNLHDLKEIISLADKIGVPSVRFLPLRRTGRAKDLWDVLGLHVETGDYERFFDEARELQQSKGTSVHISSGLSGFMFDIPDKISDDDIWCPVGRKLVVATNGNVFPCVLMMTEQFKLGNAFHENLAQIMESEKMSGICEALTERKTKVEKCSRCSWRNFCQAGCMGEVLDQKGTIWDTDRFCEYRQRLYQETFRKLLSQFGFHSGKETAQ